MRYKIKIYIDINKITDTRTSVFISKHVLGI